MKSIIPSIEKVYPTNYFIDDPSYVRSKIMKRFPTGITSYKCFEYGNGLNADYSHGSGIPTFTATRSSTTPATYIDTAGVVNSVTTSNVSLTQGGYYDTTGFTVQRGLMMYGARTNLLTYSYAFTNAAWTSTNITANDNEVTSPDNTSNAGSLTATANNGTCLRASNATGRTFSIWIRRKTGTGTISITADSETTYAAITVLSTWARFTVTAASAAQKCGIKIGTSGDAIYVWGAQYENNPYASSFIPTTTASLTRNAEVLTYLTANNRTANEETIFIKFAPCSNFANDGVNRRLTDTDTKSRSLGKFVGETVCYFFPNGSDSPASAPRTTTIPLANTSYVVCGVAYGPTAETNAEIYMNGVSEGTDTDNYTTPAWGTNFYIGSNNAGIFQLNGIIQAEAIFNRALPAGDKLAVSNHLTNL